MTVHTPFTVLSRTYTGSGTMRIRVVLRSGAVVVGDALDGSEAELLVAVGASAGPIAIATEEIASVSLREHHWAHTLMIAIGMLVAWSLLLSGLLELSFEFPALKPVIGLVFLAVVMSLIVFRAPFLAWLGRITARWRRCYPAAS